jgi:hypothetical protein
MDGKNSLYEYIIKRPRENRAKAGKGQMKSM